jgi:hypothetical protein
MGDLIETRWTRYGKDRVYVRTFDGLDVGHIDLVAQSTVVKDHAYNAALRDCFARWCPTAGQGGHTEGPGRSSQDAVPAVQPLSRTQPMPLEREVRTIAVSGDETDATSLDSVDESRHDAGRDLVANVAGAAVRAKRNEVNAQAPVFNFVARLLGMKTEERSWRVGAKGEEKVASELARLGDAWHRLHAVEVGERGSDIDHVVIGPPGVFTVNTKRHPHGKAWIGERAIMVNGQRTDYLRNSQFEGKRAAELLTRACGHPVAVTPVIVFRSLPPTLDGDAIEMIFAHARQSDVWHRIST